MGATILSQGLEHVKSDNSDWWNVGKGLQTGNQVTVIWLMSSTFTMQIQVLTKSTFLCVIQLHRSNYECTVLRVISAVKEKHSELAENVIILPNSATVHSADSVNNFLHYWGWEVLQHPSYSPDLSPCDYDLIPKLKQPLCGKWLPGGHDSSTD